MKVVVLTGDHDAEPTNTYKNDAFFFVFFNIFLATTVQFLQPQFICIAAAKRLSIFVSEQEE